jgi:DUF971 family protein
VSGPKPWPTEIRIDRAKRSVEIDFDTGERFHLPAEYLRVVSPSAEVQGHGETAPPPVSGKRHVTVTGADPVGNYAVRLQFDDGHDTGLFSWDLLYELGRNQDRLWADYLKRLSAAGLSRE